MSPSLRFALRKSRPDVQGWRRLERSWGNDRQGLLCIRQSYRVAPHDAESHGYTFRAPPRYCGLLQSFRLALRIPIHVGVMTEDLVVFGHLHCEEPWWWKWIDEEQKNVIVVPHEGLMDEKLARRIRLDSEGLFFLAS